MKISVIIPTRGRVRQLSAVLTSLHYCESRENQITYGVIVDDDDIPTKLFCIGLQKEWPITIRVGPRPQSLGGVDNEMAAHMPADVYCVLGDDMLCLTPNWDRVIAEAVEKNPKGVFWWTQPDGSPITAPIVTEAWRAAAGGIFTDYFPFWYDDLWLYELWYMVTDSEALLLPITMFDRPESTIRMRELSFWHNFYNVMRGQRVQQAFDIAEKLRLPRPVMGPHLFERLKNHSVILPEMEEDIHRRNKAESTPPGPEYNRAKERAMQLLLKAA